jgi:hypothetical protein
MGWSGGHEVFNGVARVLVEHPSAGEDLKRAVLGTLIDRLRHEDWDSEDESLQEFRDDAVIVELFRKRGITTTCGDRTGGPGTSECARKLLHQGDHVDEKDNSWWTKAKGVPA